MVNFILKIIPLFLKFSAKHKFTNKKEMWKFPKNTKIIEYLIFWKIQKRIITNHSKSHSRGIPLKCVVVNVAKNMSIKYIEQGGHLQVKLITNCANQAEFSTFVCICQTFIIIIINMSIIIVFCVIVFSPFRMN